MPFSRLAEEGSLKTSLFDIRLKDIGVARDATELDLLFNAFGCPYEIVAVDKNGKYTRLAMVVICRRHSIFHMANLGLILLITGYSSCPLKLERTPFS